MIQRSISVRVLTTLLAIAGLASAVHLAFSADDNPKSAGPSGVNATAAESQIWALEQAYWEFNRDAKHEQIIATWHDKFLGWPDGEPRPIDKEEGIRYVQKNYAQPASYTFEIEPAGIRILGNVAVNHYAVHLKWKDGRKRSMRITHTWILEQGRWKVLGGMSAGQ